MRKVSIFRIIFLYRKKALIHADTAGDTYSLVSAWESWIRHCTGYTKYTTTTKAYRYTDKTPPTHTPGRKAGNFIVKIKLVTSQWPDNSCHVEVL